LRGGGITGEDLVVLGEGSGEGGEEGEEGEDGGTHFREMMVMRNGKWWTVVEIMVTMRIFER